MARLLVTADIHGSYSTWLATREMLGPEDSLVVAGDLFGTRYPHFGSTDYQPEEIRKELKNFGHPFYFVYGNCDVPNFSPGFEFHLTFPFLGHSVYLHHGHRPIQSSPFSRGIIIQGHTHISLLKNDNGLLFLNPGSLSDPRDGRFTYSVIDENGIYLIDLKKGKTIKHLPFSE